jgi:hypothetical protein
VATSVQRTFRSSQASEWTVERLGRLTVQEIKQLRENAERLNEPGVVELCSEALKARPRTQAKPRAKRAPRTRPRQLIARAKAFEARGVYLHDPRASWGGVRKADGAIVLSLWAGGVRSADGTCSYLLWAPNVDGGRPWSDTPAGEERLEHCKRALERGNAEGLLVYGEALEGYLPEDRAHAVHGIDAEVVLVLNIEQRGDEYWAVWGKKAPSSIERG